MDRNGVDSASQLPAIQVDEIHIQQVVLDIFRNAIEALMSTSQFPKKKVVHTFQTDNQLEVVIEHTGSGAAVPNVFEPFVSSKKINMGLAISRTIVKRHGGRSRNECND